MFGTPIKKKHMLLVIELAYLIHFVFILLSFSKLGKIPSVLTSRFSPYT